MNYCETMKYRILISASYSVAELITRNNSKLVNKTDIFHQNNVKPTNIIEHQL